MQNIQTSKGFTYKLLMIIIVLTLSFSTILGTYSYGNSDIKDLKELNRVASENIQTNPEKALDFSQRAEELAAKEGHPIEEVTALINSGLAHIQLGTLDKAQEKLEKARILSYDIDFLKGVGDAENHLGIIFFEQGLYELAMLHFVKAVEIRRDNDDKIALSKSLNNIGRVHDKLLNFDKAIELFNESLSLKENKDLIGQVNTLNNLGLAYRSKKDLAFALKSFEEAYALANRIAYQQGKAYSSMNLGETYRILGQLDEAEKYALESIRLYTEINYIQAISYSTFRAGLVYQAMGLSSKALEYYDSAEALANSIKQKGLIRDILFEKAKIHEEAKDYKNALNFYKEYLQLHQELLNTDMQQRILVLQSKQEIQAKQKEIELLRKLAEAKEAEIRSQGVFLRLTTLFGIICVIVTLYLIKLISIGKQKEAQLLIYKLELEGANNQLSQLASTDFLTGAYNRRYLDDTLNRMCFEAETKNKELSLVLADIDFFKQYNDIYGHLNGDQCLLEVSRILKESLPSNKSFVSRYGGEEFVIVLNESEEAAALYAETARKRIEALALPHRGSTYNQVTCSFGVSNARSLGEYNVGLLIEAADNALYKAKHSGKNVVSK